MRLLVTSVLVLLAGLACSSTGSNAIGDSLSAQTQAAPRPTTDIQFQRLTEELEELAAKVRVLENSLQQSQTQPDQGLTWTTGDDCFESVRAHVPSGSKFLGWPVGGGRSFGKRACEIAVSEQKLPINVRFVLNTAEILANHDRISCMKGEHRGIADQLGAAYPYFVGWC